MGDILAIDVGNSRSKFGRFVPGTPLPRCTHEVAVPHASDIPWESFAAWFSGRPRIVADTTNPAQLARLKTGIPNDWEISEIRNDGTLPIPNRTDNPQRVGIDRLLNAIAANALRAEGQAAIVVDSGTAVTIDVVTPAGEFAGGAILAGPLLMAKALAEYTAALPEVAAPASSPSAIATDTESAIAAGLFWGHIGAAREIIVRQAQNFDHQPRVILTGGGAGLLQDIRHDDLLPHLVLQGLVIAADADK